MGTGARGMSVRLEGTGGDWRPYLPPPRGFAQLSTFEQAPPYRVKGPLYGGGYRYVSGRLMMELNRLTLDTWLDETTTCLLMVWRWEDTKCA